MYPYPVAANERPRLVALHQLRLLDTPSQPFFDAIVSLASIHFDCPIATIAMIDHHRQWFKARVGLDLCETPRDVAFCNYTILEPDVFVVENAAEDARFRDNPLVTGPPYIKAYAGYPLSLDGENMLGTLCVLDDRPRSFTEQDVLYLRQLGQVVEALLRSHQQALALEKAVEKIKIETSELAVKNSLLLQSERIAGIGVWSIEVATGLASWSDEVFRMHDMPVGKMPTVEEALKFYEEAERAVVVAHLNNAIDSGMPFDFEVDMVSSTGRTRRIRSSAEAVHENGRTSSLVGILQDVTAQRNAQQTLWHAANIDSLTGISNRNQFQSELTARFSGVAAGEPSVSLILLDLDGFKDINDTRGHQAGDDVLKAVAKRLSDCVPQGAMIARLGGDEFAILMRGAATSSEQVDLAEKLQAVLTKPIRTLGEEVTVSATVGIASYPRDAETCEGLLRCADIALYSAKMQERGAVAVFSTEVVNLFDRRRFAIEKAQQAIADNRLVPFYQPLVHLADQTVYGYEALARVHNSDGTISSAGDFAEAFTDAQTCRRIGERMFRLVTTDITKMHLNGLHPGIISINASPADLRLDGFADRLLCRLAECRIDPRTIKLEITETLFLGNDHKAIRTTLQTLGDAGIRIALDDFGTGFSSLTHLKDFPIHVIKIDKSFVQGLGRNAESPVIIKALVDLAHALDMTVIAEGIETSSQYEFLRSIGCDSGQGYLFGKAVDMSCVTQRCRNCPPTLDGELRKSDIG